LRQTVRLAALLDPHHRALDLDRARDDPRLDENLIGIRDAP